MEIILGIIGLVVFYLIGLLISKLKSAASKTVNQKVLYRSEFNEGKQLLEPIIIESTIPLSEVNRILFEHVNAKEEIPKAFTPVLYVVKKESDKILFAFGNNSLTKQFEALILFEKSELRTKIRFQVYKWSEGDGLITRQNEMRTFRKQILAAFEEIKIVEQITI